jgi:hypothetical protein
MGNTWWELSRKIGLLAAANEYVAVNGDAEVEDFMEAFGVDEDKAMELIVSIQI